MAPGLVIQVSTALVGALPSPPRPPRKVHPLFQRMSCLCRKIKDWWELVPQPLTSPSGAVFIPLQAVRVTKPNIPEAIRRNYELM